MGPEGNSGKELEITHAMIVAGVRELSAYDRRFDLDAECVERIFRRMCEAQVSRYGSAPGA